LTKSLRVVPEARDEIREAVDRHDLGAELFEEVDARMREIAAEPTRFAEASDVGVVPAGYPTIRQALLRRFRYRIVFVEFSDEVRVLAVAHMHRKPGYWKSRATDSK
jgi:hypothetical protein